MNAPVYVQKHTLSVHSILYRFFLAWSIKEITEKNIAMIYLMVFHLENNE